VQSYEQYAVHWIARWPLLADITTERIDAWVRDRLTQVQARTVRKWTSALRSLLTWCVERGLMHEAPTVRPLPKRAVGKVARAFRPHPDVTAEDAERVLAALPVLSERDTRHGTRCPIRAWYRVMWETGLRPATLRALEAPTHYYRGSTEILISRGADKARYARRLPLTDAARAALDEVCPDVGSIFPREPGRGHLRAAAQAAGMSPADVAALVPYSLRHARLVHLLDSGAPLLGVQYLAGHLHLTTTERYLRTLHRHAVDALAKTAAPPGEASPKPEATESKRGKS
jgi:integrase